METEQNMLQEDLNIGNRGEEEFNNLMCEIESAKRQIASLQIQ